MVIGGMSSFLISPSLKEASAIAAMPLLALACAKPDIGQLAPGASAETARNFCFGVMRYPVGFSGQVALAQPRDAAAYR